MSDEPTAGPDDAARSEQLRAGLAQVQQRIHSACVTVHRDPADVRLVVVTKYFPASDVRTLASLGVRDVGENRDQEAAAKVAELQDLRDRLTLHFIGQLQTNKAASVARYADVVHSVDRPKLVHALDKGAARADHRLEVLIQVDLRNEAAGGGRGGVLPAEAAALADAVDGCAHLGLRGVMAVAPQGVDPAPAFARLRDVADGIRTSHPDATWISAGMSGDLEAAVAHGATHLRVGSAILGSRPALR